MKHLVWSWVGVLALIAVACGGDKAPAEKPTEPAVAEATAEATGTPTTASESTTRPSATQTRITASGSGAGIRGLFGSVFQSGLNGPGSAAALGGGDESLKAFLPADGDFPDGFESTGAYAFSAPGGSEFGPTDMAMVMAVKGDPGALADSGTLDLSDIEMMMAMVMRPEDLQALGDAFGEIEEMDPEAIRDEINSSLAGMEGLEVTRFEILDASGLGEGGFGMEMTLDMSALTELLGQVGGGGVSGLNAMTMRMYIFGRGDYAGAVMRFGFSETLGDAGAELQLAAVVDGKLGG